MMILKGYRHILSRLIKNLFFMILKCKFHNGLAADSFGVLKHLVFLNWVLFAGLSAGLLKLTKNTRILKNFCPLQSTQSDQLIPLSITMVITQIDAMHRTILMDINASISCVDVCIYIL